MKQKYNIQIEHEVKIKYGENSLFGGLRFDVRVLLLYYFLIFICFISLQDFFATSIV
jgi:hypothetical protein